MEEIWFSDVKISQYIIYVTGVKMAISKRINSTILLVMMIVTMLIALTGCGCGCSSDSSDVSYITPEQERNVGVLETFEAGRDDTGEDRLRSLSK